MGKIGKIGKIGKDQKKSKKIKKNQLIAKKPTEWDSSGR